MALVYMGIALCAMGCVSLYITSRLKFPHGDDGIAAPGFGRKIRIASALSLVISGLVLVAVSYAR